MPVEIKAREARAFRETMQKPEYARDERDYKVAVHTIVSRLLTSP